MTFGVDVGTACPPSNLLPGAQVGPFSATSFMGAPPAQWPGLAPGQTIAVAFTWQNVPPGGVAHQCGLIGCITAPGGNLADPTSKGEFITYSNTAGSYVLLVCSLGAFSSIPLPAPVPQLNKIVITNDGVNYRWCMNNTTVSSTPVVARTAPDGGSSFFAGIWQLANSQFDAGGMVAFAALNRSASNAELQAWANVYPNFTIGPLQSRYVFPASLTGDSQCTVDWNAFRDWNGSAGTTTSRGTTPVTFTINGMPGSLPLTPTTEILILPTDQNMSETSPGVNMGLFNRYNALARLKVNTPSQQVAVLFVGNDTNVGTNPFDQLEVNNNGVGFAQAPTYVLTSSQNDGQVHTWWQQFGGFTVPQTNNDVWVDEGAQIWGAGGTVPFDYRGGFIYGIIAAVGTVSTKQQPKQRLVVFGDSIDLAYYQGIPLGWTQIARTHFGPKTSIQSTTNTTPTTVTTTANHGYVTGNYVNVSGHAIAGYNGTWQITVTGLNTFQLNGTTAAGAGGASGVVRNLSQGGLTVLAQGGRSLHDDAVAANDINQLAAQLVSLCQDVQAGGSKTLLITMAYNDYTFGYAGWTPTAFGTSMAGLVQKVNALDSSIIIYTQGAIPSANEAIPNGIGFTLAQYRTAEQTAINAIAGGNIQGFVNPVTLGWVIPTSDGIHPTAAGYVTQEGLEQGILGY